MDEGNLTLKEFEAKKRLLYHLGEVDRLMNELHVDFEEVWGWQQE